MHGFIIGVLGRCQSLQPRRVTTNSTVFPDALRFCHLPETTLWLKQKTQARTERGTHEALDRKEVDHSERVYGETRHGARGRIRRLLTKRAMDTAELIAWLDRYDVLAVSFVEYPTGLRLGCAFQ
jgi:hypothetical protein